ncbi:MAG TPA: hypothetical protein VGE07_21430 [Herpetosiphonaceae bacterium]
MSNNQPQDSLYAGRLLRQLEGGKAGACAEFEEQIDDFVRQETAGADVDAMEEFQAVLAHIDTCVACAAAYAQLVEDLAIAATPPARQEELIDFPVFFSGTAVPEKREPAYPALFAPDATRERDGMRLDIWTQGARAVRLQAPGARLNFSHVMSGGALFSDRLPEWDSAAFVVSPRADGPAALVQVTLRDPGRAAWTVWLKTAAATRSLETDARGIAEFRGLPAAELAEPFEVFCVETGGAPGATR